jgi:pyochelin synthetase
VAVVLDKGWDQIAAVLGVLYAGAAYLPIDPRQPLARRQQLLELGQVQVAVVHDSASTEYGAGYTLVAVDDKQTLAQDATPLPIEQRLDDLAYVIFTSGSTGQPKGVMIDHRGAINTVLDMNQRFAVTAQDVVLSVSALNFDLSVYDIFGVLGAGGTLVLPEPERLTDPAHWNELMRRHGVTLWNSVPALLQIWLDYLQASAIKADSRLRMAWLSGDWIPVKLPDQAHALLPELQLISLGGATEASIWSIYYPISQVGTDWASIPYGKPLANQTMHVLNAQMQDCPMWAEGDIYIGGVGLAKGYWGDAEKTQERFIAHPQTGRRLYKTGDLGRYLPDGNIEFLGRSDFQVKLNGYRVELGEIAAQLRKQPGVQEAFVTVTEPEGERKKQLVAYVVAQAGLQTALNQADLRTALAQLLPEYMVPYHYVVLERLPLSANGKVDVRQLPQPQTQEPDVKPAQPPRTDTETQLHRMWAGVFGRSDFGVTDNFFDLGGNSLDVVGVATKVQASYGLQQLEQRELLQYFFEQPTIEGLAARVDAWMLEREEDMQLV